MGEWDSGRRDLPEVPGNELYAYLKKTGHGVKKHFGAKINVFLNCVFHKLLEVPLSGKYVGNVTGR